MAKVLELRTKGNASSRQTSSGTTARPVTIEVGVGSRPDRYPLDLVECEFVLGAVVELGGARALVSRDLLRLLDRPAVLEVGGDANGPT